MPFGGGEACVRCGKTVYFNEEVMVQGKKIHSSCGKCCKCNCKLDAGNGRYVKGEFKCANCVQKESDNSFSMAPITGTQSDAPDACPKCGKKVYMAEEVRAVGKKFHKSCFTCQTCNTRLDSTTLSNKDSNIYCKSCYAKEFGPKGYGYGQGSGALPFTQ